MKKTLSFVLALTLCLGLTVPAFAAGVTQQPSVENSLHFNSSARAACVLKSNGELWGYIFDRETCAITESKLLLTGVTAVTEGGNFGIPHYIGLALKSDGSLYEVNMQWENEPAMVTEYITNGVAAVNRNCYLKTNGDLYYYGRTIVTTHSSGGGFGSSSGSIQLTHQRLAQNVTKFAGTVPVPLDQFTTVVSGGNSGPNYVAYITSDQVLHYEYNGEAKTMSGVRDIYQWNGVYFAVTNSGDLYAWGNNDHGRVGNGGKYDKHVILLWPNEDGTVNVHCWVLNPTKVLSNVTELYFDDSYVCAKDTFGTIWKWGDPPKSIRADSNTGGIIKPDPNYCTPRKAGSGQPVYQAVNSVNIKSNGALTVEAEVWIGDYGARKEVTLPITYSQVMKAGTSAPVQPQQPSKSETAMPTNDKLTVNGKLADPTVYKIGDSNYFKIRDVAALLDRTEKQFSVGYDNALKSVTATTGQGYAKQDGDLMGAPIGGNQTAAPSNDTIYVNGQKIDAAVYKIGGSNYFKLRDLGRALNFSVEWSKDAGMIIDTSKPYSE